MYKMQIYYFGKSQREFKNIREDVKSANAISVCKHFNQDHDFNKCASFTSI